LWGERAEKIAGYIVKGDSIGVSGQLSVREYDSQKSKGFSVELNVSEVQLLGGKRENQERPQAPAKQPATDEVPYNDDIPF
jgi:single-stranded DNA-binding protein